MAYIKMLEWKVTFDTFLEVRSLQMFSPQNRASMYTVKDLPLSLQVEKKRNWGEGVWEGGASADEQSDSFKQTR